jgi:Ca2+-binding RTX toxin-like protein
MENLELNSFNPGTGVNSALGVTDAFAREQSFLRAHSQLYPTVSLEIPSVSSLALSLPLEPTPCEILGTAGRDILVGTVENKRFVGRQGADLITGGLGNDIFVYQSIQDTGDTLKDFELTSVRRKFIDEKKS